MKSSTKAAAVATTKEGSKKNKGNKEHRQKKAQFL